MLLTISIYEGGRHEMLTVVGSTAAKAGQICFVGSLTFREGGWRQQDSRTVRDPELGGEVRTEFFAGKFLVLFRNLGQRTHPPQRRNSIYQAR
jgi:hypothetical protein